MNRKDGNSLLAILGSTLFFFLLLGFAIPNVILSVTSSVFLILMIPLITILNDSKHNEEQSQTENLTFQLQTPPPPPLAKEFPPPPEESKPFKMGEYIPLNFSKYPESSSKSRIEPETPKSFKIEPEPLAFSTPHNPPKPSNTNKYAKANEMRNNPTPAERRMGEILNSNIAPRFPEHLFYSQYLQSGYILDFYFPSLKLAIEVDGGSHNNRQGYDWERDSNLSKYGIQVLRATNEEVFNNPKDLADSLCKIIEEKNQDLIEERFFEDKRRKEEERYRRKY